MLEKAPSSSTVLSVVLLTVAEDLRFRHAVNHALTFGSETIVLFDQAPGSPLPDLPIGARGYSRPLDGDFGMQRNAAQAKAKAAWVLHLDTDEEVHASVLSRLPAILATAEAYGIEAIGFPRRNEVDGNLSSLYPDTQYRLVRRSARFEGRVHERPTACQDWTKTMIALTPGLRHSLSSEHVIERRERYNLLGQSEERRRESEDLLRSFPRR
jgi:hypothetical protein